MKLLKTFLITILSLSFFACSSTQKHQTQNSDLKKITKSPHRSEDAARDKYRHPVQTLEFFEIEPQHTVIEVNPGNGWYTKIIGPYLKDSGKLYLAIFDKRNKRSFATRYNKRIKEVVKDKTLFGDIEFTTADVFFDIGKVAPDESADRVITFRNMHGWVRANKDKEVFDSFFKALKPGGILGVVQHRLAKDLKQDKKASTGYVNEDYVIEVAKSAGFELVAKSEINSNKADTTKHKNGVWTLPPVLNIDDNLKAKYKKIGESDRMTLKFKKPKI